MLLLELVLFSLLQDFLKFFFIFLALLFDSVTKALSKLHSVAFDLVVLLSCELVPFAQVTLVASTLFDFSTLEFLQVGYLKVTKLLRNEGSGRVCALECLNEVAGEGAFFRRDESHSESLIAGSSSPADAMDVVFEVVGTHVIDH